MGLLAKQFDSLKINNNYSNVHNENSTDFYVDLFESEEVPFNKIDSYWNSTYTNDNIFSYW